MRVPPLLGGAPPARIHVTRRVDDGAHLKRIVTGVFVGNLDILVSHLDDCDKLDRMLSAADLLIERGAMPRRE